MRHSICVFGLGYVGLPLALEFSKKYNVVGYDYNVNRIKQLILGNDKNHSISKKNLSKSKVRFTPEKKNISKCKIFIITVPTPVNQNKQPNLSQLKDATKVVSKFLKKDDIVIFESTVYPGLTEEELVPILEKYSKLKYNKDFFVGYSPERISPGDKNNITKIKKVVSGSNRSTGKKILNLYKSIIKAGIYLAPNIKTAEACKILENIQRDVNISLMNEASIIFDKLNIDTFEVLKAAKTKWNFLNFSPGLVGGHCISVDPYYMKFKAEQLGLKTQVISSGRAINEKIAKSIFSRIMNYSRSNKIKLKNIGIMGLTFKENSSDMRNSQIFKLIEYFKKRKVKLQLLDPRINKSDLQSQYKQFLVKKFKGKLDCLVLSTPHKEFLKLSNNYFKNILKKNSLLFDVKRKRNFKFSNSVKILSL